MAEDTMTCPACHGMHPAGSAYCTELWIPIDSMQDITNQDDDAGRGQQITHEPSSEPTADDDAPACPVCQDTLRVQNRCRQCGYDFGGTTSPPVTIVLPSGESIPVPSASEVVIGRLSEDPTIRDALEPFEAVSRRHCTLRVDPDGAHVTVKDLRSSNGTWVGDDPEQLAIGESRRVPLPARIRLGRHLSLTIRAQEERP